MIEDDIKQIQQDISNLDTRTVDTINQVNKLEKGATGKAKALGQIYDSINKLYSEIDIIKQTLQQQSTEMEESRSIADSAHRQADNAYDRARETQNLIQPKEHGRRYRNRLDEIDRRLDELEHRPSLEAV